MATPLARAPDLESRLAASTTTRCGCGCACSPARTMIEREMRRRLRERFGTTLPRFDLMAQLDRAPGGPARWASCRAG